MLSLANRDPGQFASPDKFDPSRSNLRSMVGWNGRLDEPAKFPRICPGRDVSIEVIKAVIGMLPEVGA